MAVGLGIGRASCMAIVDIGEKLRDDSLRDIICVPIRPSFGEAGPSGGDNPLITPEGHFVLDVVFTTPITAGNLPMSSEVAENLETIPGVMGHGLVIDVA
nr:hypothetical protein PHYPA_007061 [Physcomitrium patens]